jgi:formylglycine-generating enzyme required for sulfatase activity/serine/threonine protein kinase
MNEESSFAAALEKKSPAEREAFLQDACRGNAELRAQVEELLSASNAAGSFFEHPPAGLDVTVDAADHETHKPAGWDGSLAFLKPTDKPGRIGKLVGNAGEYEIIEVVGSGGMGIVLRAFDTKLSRVVAVKVLAPELARNPTAVKRFLREAKAAAAVVHDHVVTIHNVEETHQPPFLVMQYIDGQTLQQKIDREGALELKEILRIGCQAAAGLAAAHKHGLVHRDVKPANILLENGIERVKITDFGLARAADDVEITQTGLIAGTPQYMSPEQARGEPMDARSDLFSLGSVLYTMCTGRPAFRADTTMGVIRRVCDDEPRPIHEVNGELPAWLEGIVNKLLAKEPGERFQTALEVSELLGQCLAHVQNPASAPLPAVAFAAPATVFLPPPPKSARSRFRIPSDWLTFMFVMVFSVVVVLPLVLVTVSVMAWLLHRGEDTKSAEFPAETRPNITGEWFSDRGEALHLSYAVMADLRDEIVHMDGRWNWVDRPTNLASRLVNARFHQQRRVLESELKSSDGSKVSVVWELGDGDQTLLGNVTRDGKFVRDWNLYRQRPKVSEVISLFNGEDLAGWRAHPESSTAWTVKDKLLVGRGMNQYLVSEQSDYWDFRLRAEVKVGGQGDGGILVRMAPPAASPDPLSGYEVQIVGDPNHVSPTGSIIRHGASVATENAVAPGANGRGNLIRPDQWFKLEISAIGGMLTVSIDGQPVVNYYDDAPRTGGHIALQTFSDTAEVSFRKIEIQELLSGRPRDIGSLAGGANASDWVPLLSGNDLRGWIYDKREQDPDLSYVWKMDGGLLSAAGRDSGTAVLRSEKTYENYELQLKFRFPEADAKSRMSGDGGLILHRPSAGPALQALGFKLVLGRAAAGKLLDVQVPKGGRTEIAAGRPLSLAPPGQWNDLVIASRSGTLEVSVNSQLAALLTDCSPRRGYIALQAQGTPIELRDMLIREEPSTAPTVGWTPLFDGTSLSGWRTHSDQPGDWKVENRLLVGSGRVSHLFTKRGDYENFHLRFEAKVNAGGDSGVIFRAPFGIKPGWKGPLGFEAQIATKTGTVLEGQDVFGDPSGIPPGTWFTGEVIAAGPQIIVRIDGRTTANFEDAERLYTKGHIALQVWNPQTVVQFRKIEIKELPATSAAAAAANNASPQPAVAPFDAAQAKSHQGKWAAHLGIPVEVTNSLAMRLCLIPPGEFTMGSSAGEQRSALDSLEQTMRRVDQGDEQGRVAYVESIRTLVASEGPAHRVALTAPYFLSATEVTESQFEAFVKATNYVTSAEQSEKGGIVWGRAGHESSKEFQWRNPGRIPRTPDHPVTQVSYDDALAFCRWLSEKEGVRYELPTEAQWEFACRAGTQSPWFFGSNPAEIDQYAWAEVRVDPSITEFEFHAVGQKRPNAFGLFDMHGNVQEWCRDWFSLVAYSVGREVDPTGPQTPDAEQIRVVRGGSIFLPEDLRSAIRRRASLQYAENGLGFRVAVVGNLKSLGPVARSSLGAAPAEPKSRVWGEVKNGWQVGIGFKGGKTNYAPGEPVELELKVRNATNAETAIEIARPQEAYVGFEGTGSLSVRILGREREKLTLAPSEERIVPLTPDPNGESAAPFAQDQKAASALTPRIKTDGLTTGFYRVEVATSLAGEKQTLASPEFGFQFDDGGNPPAWTNGRKAAEGPPNNPELKNVVWGEPVLGLSLGIGPPVDASEPAEGGMTIYLWNTTSEAIDVQHLEHRAQDWQLVIHGADGNERRTIPILTGPKMLTRAHLEPGQVVTPGSTTLKRLWNAGVNPPAKLSPGAYKVTTTFDCRRLDYGHLSLRLTSGEANVEIK